MATKGTKSTKGFVPFVPFVAIFLGCMVKNALIENYQISALARCGIIRRSCASALSRVPARYCPHFCRGGTLFIFGSTTARIGFLNLFPVCGAARGLVWS
jgi:hypothetical protein